MTKVLFTILFLTMTAAAQTVHVAANIGVTGNLGFANPQLGANVGISHRKARIGFSGDFTIDHVRKNVGGNGYQITGRETLRIFKDRFFVQGGAQESHYAVKLFSKNSIAPLGGVGWATGKSMVEATFLADVTSPNHGRIVEGRVTFLLPHHAFLRFRGAADNFVQGKSRMTGGLVELQVGWWK